MRRCCPESCNTGIFTEEDCNNSIGKGSCDYPNAAQSQCERPFAKGQ